MPSRRAPRLRLGLGLLLWVGGCGGDDAPGDPSPRAAATSSVGVDEVVDAAGRAWSFEHPPVRIVSLVPAATSVLLEIGAGEALVARTDYDQDPRMAVLPSVGGGLGPSMEVMLSLRPELVVRFEGPTDRDTPRQLDRLDIPHLAVRPDGIADVLSMIDLLGRVTGREARADALSRRIREELDAVAAAVEGADRPRIGVLLGGDPPWVVGGASFIHELVTLAGGDNIFGSEGPLYAPMAVEEILQRDPEFLLLAEGARIPQGLRHLPVLRAPPGLQEPGPGLGSIAREIGRILHPERFP